MSFNRDTLFDAAQEIVDFRFDERVAAVFPDMIHRSIPGYATLLQLIAVIGAPYLKAQTCVYDLGCALGGASIALYPQLPPEAKIIAVDNAPAMVARLAAFAEGRGLTQLQVLGGDILTLPLEPCALVVLNFTLQFIAKDARDALLAKIYAALQPGGALLIAEKNQPEHEMLRHYHEAFKRAQGYSELAVAQKRESLEKVMPTDRAACTEDRLKRAGFATVTRYFQALSFAAWVAVK